MPQNDAIKVEAGAGGVSVTVTVSAIPWAALISALAPIMLQLLQAWLAKQPAPPKPNGL